MIDLVSYLQAKLNEIAPNRYNVSKERNVDADYNISQVVVSALSGAIYKESSTLPYQIDIVTNDIDSVMIDFNTLARNNNNEPYTQIITNDEVNYESVTITPFFNTPVVMEKDIAIGSDKYARLVVFAQVNEQKNVNNIKSITIDGESIEILNGTYVYTTELSTSRVSGVEMNKNKKKVSSCSVTFNSINHGTVFFNKAFKISTGSLSGNTSFNVVITLNNGMSATLKMIIGSYTLSTERAKLPSVNIGLFLYDDRGDTNA